VRNCSHAFEIKGIYGVLILMLGLLLAGCAINRPVDTLAEACRLRVRVIKVPIPNQDNQASLVGTNQMGVIGEALGKMVNTKMANTKPERGKNAPPEPTRNLVLSGGGQHGSFGSGFLLGIYEAKLFKPYDLVTGVSTGALQATFALLGDEQAPSDRILSVSDDFPANANRRPRTNLHDLAAGYTITNQRTLYNDKGTIGIIRNATRGNLEPLSKRLDQLITRETLEAVKRANGDGRKLFVALLNYESGDTEIVDMTELAAQLDDSNFALIKHCYNQVLIAASSEPISTPPVVINGKLYFDAGLRYGVFLEQFLDDANAIVKSMISKQERQSGTIQSLIQTDIIVNGDLRLESSGGRFARKFSTLDIAARGREILVNQVYRFSVSEVIKSREKGHSVRFAAILPSATIAAPPARGAIFDPLYMKRMIENGRNRGYANDWQRLDTLPRLME
jgi:predicted acylesterase/phospholipase RssA